MEVAALLAERDRVRLTAEEERANEEALARAVLTLWQTSILRRTRLKVVDEVANGLSYYDYTFSASCHGSMRSSRISSPKLTLPGKPRTCPRFCTWGVDRGRPRRQPFRDGEVLHQALRMQSRRALSFYLDELHLLGGELSLDARLVVFPTSCEIGRSLAGSFATPGGRTVPSRHLWHLRSGGSDGVDAPRAPRHAVGQAPHT